MSRAVTSLKSRIRPKTGPKVGAWASQTIQGYLFILPLVILMGFFVFYPLVNTIRLSFYDYAFVQNTSAFVGVQNYVDLVKDPRAWESLWVSVKFFLYYVPTSMLVALVIALCIDRVANNYFATLYRTIFYFPVVLPAAIVFQMWIWLYDPSLGFFARITQFLGLGSLNWLGNPDLALPALALMSVWRLLGETMILFLVGLANIPRELTEAAKVDGATELQAIWKITLPLLKPIIFLILVLRLQLLGLIVEPLFMTEGGPIDSTMTYGLQAFYIFYEGDQVGYASTWFVALGLMAVTIAFVAWKWLRPESG